MSTFPLRIPDELKQAAAAQAEASGVSLNHYVATVLATGIGARAEAERYFTARGRRAVSGRAKAILAGSGLDNPPVAGDVVD